MDKINKILFGNLEKKWVIEITSNELREIISMMRDKNPETALAFIFASLKEVSSD